MTSLSGNYCKVFTVVFIVSTILLIVLSLYPSVVYKSIRINNVEREEPSYSVAPVLQGKLCTSKLKNSYYYPIPGVCQLNCSLIPIPYPKKHNGLCKKVKESIIFEKDEIVALDNVNVIFTNTYMYHNQSKEKNEQRVILKKGERSKILYEQISVKDRENNETLYLKFIPTKLTSNRRKDNQYHVNLYLLDGLSRSQFSEQMVETINYLNTLMDGDFDIFEFYRYHTIGHNSIPNYLPIFYGINETTANNDTNSYYYKELPNKIYNDKHYKTLLLQQFCDRNLNYHHPHVKHIGCDHEFLLGCHPDMY